MAATERAAICPYCAEELRPGARKCRFCGEFLVRPREGLAGFLSQHFTLVVSLAVFSFIFLKVLAASRYSTATALALVQAAGATQVIMGIVLGLFTLLLTLIVLAIVGARALKVRMPTWTVALAGIAGLGIVFLPPWPTALINVVALLIVAPLLRWLRSDILGPERAGRTNRGGATRSSSSQLPLFTLIALLGTLVLSTALSPTMWLPAERMTIGDETVVGYVLSEEAGWTTLLNERTRNVSRVRSETLLSRQVCEAPAGRTFRIFDPLAPSLARLLFFPDDPRPPACP
jgi:hypothetical protein